MTVQFQWPDLAFLRLRLKEIDENWSGQPMRFMSESVSVTLPAGVAR